MKFFIGVGLALVLVGAFVGWSIFSPDDDEQVIVRAEENLTPQQTLAVQNQEMPGNDYEDGTGRSAIYNFFYKIFGGIEEGLEDSPHNLNNVEHLDDRNLNAGTNTLLPVKSEQASAQQAYQARSQATVTYKNSLSNIVGSDVFGNKGEVAGEVFDIIVHKKTGQAQAIIINDDSTNARSLSAVGFKQVLKQNEEGDVTLTVSEDIVKKEPAFDYSSLENTNYVSLRNLQDGQLLDYEGKVAGQIDGIIYENAEVQNIYFTLRPILVQNNAQNASTFQLPFKEINIIKNNDGYDIKLDKEQTQALAKSLFTE